MEGEIKRKRIQGDSEALRAMGTRGGINAGLMNADRRNQTKDDMDKFMAAQAQIYTMNDEGDILPPDSSSTPPTKH